MDSLGIVDVHDWHPTVIEVEPIEAAIVNGDPATLVESQQQVCPGDQGCATRTSARRSRPTTTSCPAANVRSDPSYRTVNTGGAAGWLIGTNCIGTAADAGAGAPGQASRPSRPAVASANLLATFPSGLAGLLHAHSNRRFLLDGQRRLRRVSSGGHSRTGHGVLGQRPDGGVGALQRRAVGRRPGLGGAGAAEREAEGADGDNRSGRRCSRGVGGASRGRGRGAGRVVLAGATEVVVPADVVVRVRAGCAARSSSARWNSRTVTATAITSSIASTAGTMTAVRSSERFAGAATATGCDTRVSSGSPAPPRRWPSARAKSTHRW